MDALSTQTFFCPRCGNAVAMTAGRIAICARCGRRVTPPVGPRTAAAYTASPARSFAPAPRPAISGWSELISPAVAQFGEGIGIWPFDGAIVGLLRSRRIVIVETYPKDVFHRMGFPPQQGWSKRCQHDRAARAQAIHDWIAAAIPVVVLEEPLVAAVNDGFGAADTGEDKFDSVIGLLGMLHVLVGGRPEGAPNQPAVQLREGWIFGQQ